MKWRALSLSLRLPLLLAALSLVRNGLGDPRQIQVGVKYGF
jgi:hypothetical protein